MDSLLRHGTVVRLMSPRLLRDSFDILRAIEPIAARHAAESDDGTISASMQQWPEDMQELAEKRVPRVSEAMLHAHRESHLTLFRAAGGEGLQRHLCMLWNTCERCVTNSLSKHGRQAAAAREHADSARCLQECDSGGTANVLPRHLEANRAGSSDHLTERVAQSCPQAP
ncbi:FCD domain-containing protein [Streptomyces sulphureus]|uniref:FCD domain-containing protein n=1 Tax=Streptomyces sulphureus TaxID=47758 RepID=UPI00039D47EB|nr:FCD domain-containing protein [Streptomyces sulphureus]